MITYVINKDSETNRWETIRDHLQSYGLEPIRWSATEPDGSADVDAWDYVSSGRSPERSIAILRSYRSLFEHLLTTDDDQWLIVQDDVRFTEDPARDSEAELYLYGGYFRRTLSNRTYVVDPRYSAHIDPEAFRIDRSAVPDLLELWSDETQRSCVSWLPLLRSGRMKFDKHPTAFQEGG